MEQRFSLEAAGKLFGITANAMRARAKKSPEKYRMERDNGGKIWLWIDTEGLLDPKAVKAKAKGSKSNDLKASIDALVVSRMWWKLPSSGLRACDIGSSQAARSRDIGSSG